MKHAYIITERIEGIQVIDYSVSPGRTSVMSQYIDSYDVSIGTIIVLL